ncbi:MAG TPA: glycerol-3-phosphate 1-O-acyltransferase PlsY [Ktedonobacterales bacterium]|jgi:glycerol-3-phosphate acyltransferase PlsY|nr:glycerol-3-phosphate 1-O-acyltransferase PlsY [Ktedonobacterales bacterium]
MNPVLLKVGQFALTAVVGYVSGSIPSGVLAGKLFGNVDPRQHGSGKTGATNILRTLGPRAAIAVALMDVLKGVVPVLLARFLLFRDVGIFTPPELWGETVAGYAALLGHNYSMFIGFRGGRGVATGGGATLAMQPLTVLFGAVGLILPVWLTKYVSLGSIVAAATCAVTDAVLVALRIDYLPHLVFIAGGAAVVIYAHRDNIVRLVNGTERKLGQKA